MADAALRKQYMESGRIFMPSLIDSERVGRLRVICEHILSQWRVCSPETGRPGIEEPDAPSMRHMNHPGYFRDRREWLAEILELVADERVLDVARTVFDDEPLFRCTSLFMNPLDRNVDGNWHRDWQFMTQSDAVTGWPVFRTQINADKSG